MSFYKGRVDHLKRPMYFVTCMLILGIESSCDDTSVALVQFTPSTPHLTGGEQFLVLAEKTASQIEAHKKYGGVVPEVAGRQHAENILPVIESVMARGTRHKEQNTNKPDLIAVTAGPGLITGLLVGVEAAKTLSYLWDVPLVAVNHIAGHAHSVQLQNHTSKILNGAVEFPAVCLVVSGGHTELLLMKYPTTFALIGKTRDDAAGECFDKVGKLLGFDYPGGPKISAYAAQGNSLALAFPRPMRAEDNYDFSFAGLKTAALYWLRDNQPKGVKPNTYNLQPKTLKDFCASFEQAIVDVLVAKTLRATEQYKPKTIILGGGVSANKKLRDTLGHEIKKQHPLITYRLSPVNYSMDNGAMIAVAGYYKTLKKEYTNWRAITVDPNWKVYENVIRKQ